MSGRVKAYYVSPERFAEEVRFCAECVRQGGIEAAEACAQSYGL